MRKSLFFSLIILVVGSLAWANTHPLTAKGRQVVAPQEPNDNYVAPPETHETLSTTTTTIDAPAPPAELDFSKPDATLEIKGVRGDNVTFKEMVGPPQKLEDLNSNVGSMLTSCTGYQERSMAVRVDVELSLDSSLPAAIDVNFGVLDRVEAFDYGSGPACSDGDVRLNLEPNEQNRLSFWVALEGAISPAHPDGDFTTGGWYISSPGVTLPNVEPMHWHLWGPRVLNCSGVWGDTGVIWLAGKSPAQTEDDCRPATNRETALGTA